MKFSEFRSGVFKQQYQYKSFSPTPINHDWNWDSPRINVMLEQATRALAELDAYSLIVPDIDLFTTMHIYKEAATSSKIEGTHTGIDEAILDEDEIAPERRDDWREVHNYVSAMNKSIKQLDELPLSLRLLRDTHKILMSGVRGEHKTPGDFRKSQNWIGGATLADATFIPPHHDELPYLLKDLEEFIHNSNLLVPHLIKVAICHYQFETIHPFLDGNGRIGRLLITLYLISFGLLKKPSLYLSDHLEKNRQAYYDSLSRVREYNDIDHWCRFFLQAVITTAGNSKRTFQQVLELKQQVEQEISPLERRAENARKIISYMYSKPAASVNDVVQALGIQFPATNKLMTDLTQMGILREITGKRRNRLFLFKRYFEIFLT